MVFLAGFSLWGGCQSLDFEALALASERQRLAREILLSRQGIPVKKDDEPLLIELLKDENPEVRLAVLMILEANPSPLGYDAIVDALIDPVEEVRKKAEEILLESWKESYTASVRGLSRPNQAVALSAARLIVKKGRFQDRLYLLTLFDSPNKDLRTVAAQGYAALGNYEDPLFVVALKSEAVLFRETAVETLSYFNSPAVIPLLLSYINDPARSVRFAALFGLANLGQPALETIHKEVLFSRSSSYRLALLEVVDGAQDPISLNTLVTLLDDPDQEVSLKARELLLRQGTIAIPFLDEGRRKMGKQGLLHMLELLKVYKEEKALPILYDYLAHPDEDIRRKAFLVEESFASRGENYLLEAVTSGPAPRREAVLAILVERRVPGLVYDPIEKRYKRANIFYLFEQTPPQKVEAYLDEVDLPLLVILSLTALYELERGMAEYQRVYSISNRTAYPYFYLYRQWEAAQVSSELSRQDTFNSIHNYFETKEEDWLNQSRQAEEISGEYERRSKALYKETLEAGKRTSDTDRALVETYLRSRQQVVENWQSLGAEVQPLGGAVLQRYNINIQDILWDYDLFRGIPRKSQPTPDKL